MLFESQLKRKEQNRDLELGNEQLSFSLMKAAVSWNNWKNSCTTLRGSRGRRQVACVRVFMHACVSVCVLHLTILRTQGSSTAFCSTLFYSICATSPLPSLVQQALSACSGKLHLPWNHKPQLLDFPIVLQRQCCFMGCVSVGGTFYLWHKAQM